MENNEAAIPPQEPIPEEVESDLHPEEEQFINSSALIPPSTSQSANRNIYQSNSNEEISFKDPLFPYNQQFASKTRKEQELLFLRAFEEQTLFIRNKELKCTNSPMEPLLTEDTAQRIIDGRQSYFDSYEKSECRKAINRKTTEFSNDPAPRIDVATTPTFNTLLNVHFESQFSMLDQFKTIISTIITRNRVASRTRSLTQYLINQATNAVKSLQDQSIEKAKLSANSLLSLRIECCRKQEKFADPYQMEAPPTPEINIEIHRVEKQFNFAIPGLVERYQLTPFARTDITSYIAAPIAPPETFPTLKEEQPVRERINPSIDISEEMTKEVINQEESPPLPNTMVPSMPKVIHYPREIRYYDFDPSYCLRPQPIQLPELPDEIGRASVLALPLTEYEKMSLAGKTKAPFAPFEFSGITKFMESGLTPMTEANPIDLKELEADDDIDGIDITPKVRPASDFITKPLSTKNKSHALQEAVTEGQQQWKQRQKKGVNELIDRIQTVNNLMRDKSLCLPINDLIQYTKE